MFIKTIFHLLLVFIFFERIRSTFSNKKTYQKYGTPKERFLCSFMVFLYISILLTAFSEVYQPEKSWSFSFISLGLLVWYAGVWYRRISINALGKNWSIFRTPDRLKRIVPLGPFEYSRHPYYSASILELVGYSLIFGSPIALMISLFLYLPLTLLRIMQEEQFLLSKFPEEYARYKEETPLIFSFRKYVADSRLFNHLKQFFLVSRKYGWGQIAKIVSMNRAVKSYFRNYMISQCIAALSKINFLDELTEDTVVDIVAFSEKDNIDLKTLKLICDYLYVMRIFNKKVLSYSFTNYGKDLIENSRGVFDFIYAYAPIFESLPAILKKEKSYGKEIDRRGEFVGRASAELAELFPFPVARAFLSKYDLKNILDLGSGSGDFLIGFCKEKGIRGTGVDLSPDAVNYAMKKAREKGVGEKANFIVGDIMKLKECIKPDDSVDVITSMFVLHEFLSISEQLVIDVFKSVKEAFPNKYILICELTRCSLDHLYHSPSGVTEHHLFHNLSNQGLATSEEWRQIFHRAGLTLIEEERLDIAEQSIFLLKPNILGSSA